jgi:glutaredoxin
MGPRVKVYGAKTCIDTQRARQFLARHNIPYQWFDVDEDHLALNLIRSVNNGNRTTPTIFFDDGSILFEPTNETLAAKLALT